MSFLDKLYHTEGAQKSETQTEYYVVYSYVNALGLNINKTNLTVKHKVGEEYPTMDLINIMSSIIIKGMKTKVANLTIINFIKV